MERPLEGRVALVTGAGVRLGRAIAEALGHAGADVAVHYNRSADGAEQAAAAIRMEGNRAALFSADLGQPAQVDGLVDRVEKELGPLRILVNSAGILERTPFAEATDDALERLWAINARAPFILTRAAARRMRPRGGDVVNIVDVGGGLMPWREHSAYCMSKAALAMLTRSLALELAPQIRVNAVAPGAVLPPESLSPQEREVLRQRIPLQRFGEADDVARTVVFLVSGPQFITGQMVAVDGGRAAGAAR